MEFVTAILEFVRREVKRLFFNEAPVAALTLNSQIEPGTVTGSLNVSDPEDDPLAYSLTQHPANGTVVIDPDGDFTYTADEDMAASGGTDTFVVTVRDTGFHLNFWAPPTTQVPVTVTVTGMTDPGPSDLPTASIADLSVTEGNGQHAHFMFTVSLSQQSDSAVTLHYATVDGSATAGQDYVAGSGTLTFAPGVTSQTVHVDIVGDAVEESDETFTVTLSAPSGATISRATATGTIVDDDMAMPGPGDDGDYIDLASFGDFHGSDHTDHSAFEGGRTAITTEALVAYNNLREFAGLTPATLEDVGTWAFANQMTNNAQAWDNDLKGVGLYYAMQGAKVGWIADDKYDPQIVADIERTARLGSADDVMAMVAEYGHEGFADFLMDNGYDQAFIDTLKMEPHYAGWMHDRAQGKLSIEGVATSHDVNHLTVLSHDQLQPFMNDTWDWPQWPALDVSDAGVIEYFQSMVSLGNPVGENLSDLDAPHSAHAM
ncbi:MAG: Calx-beta domain-containing protein [Mycobacterium sp.]